MCGLRERSLAGWRQTNDRQVMVSAGRKGSHRRPRTPGDHVFNSVEKPRPMFGELDRAHLCRHMGMLAVRVSHDLLGQMLSRGTPHFEIATVSDDVGTSHLKPPHTFRPKPRLPIRRSHRPACCFNHEERTAEVARQPPDLIFGTSCGTGRRTSVPFPAGRASRARRLAREQQKQ